MSPHDKRIIWEIRRQGRLTRWTIVGSVFGGCVILMIFLTEPMGVVLLGVAAGLLVLAAVVGAMLGKAGGWFRDRVFREEIEDSEGETLK